MINRLWVLINCKINKILSLLAIMIFIVALSCADARVLTEIELKNFILNGYRDMKNSIPTETIVNNVLNKDWSTWLNLMQTHERALWITNTKRFFNYFFILYNW